MKKLLLPTLAMLILMQACKKDKGPELEKPSSNLPYTADNSFKIVAYFPSYRDPDAVDNNKYKLITHLNYAFLNPDENGNLKPLAQPQRFGKVIAAARVNNIKMGISVSGSSTVFKALAANPASRTLLIKNLASFVKQYKLDGVDMDWEYPRADDGSKNNFTALMKELSDTLHAHNKYLSAAVTPAVYAGAVRDGISSDIFQAVDFLNIMVYDGLNWDKSAPKQHSSYKMAEESLNIWQNMKGLSREKTVLGIPAYGRNISNPAAGYRELISAGADPLIDSAVYNGQMYYYNGINTVKSKALLAKQKANGIMLWEFYFDTNDATSLLKAVNDALDRNPLL